MAFLFNMLFICHLLLLIQPIKHFFIFITLFCCKTGTDTYFCAMKLEDAIRSSKFSDEQHKATLNILYTAYLLKQNLSTALKADGLTIEQHNVLRILKGSHPTELCVKDIASRILEKNSNVPRIIDRLVAKKLAKRTTSKEDKRETLVSLTDKGITTIEHARKVVDQITKDIVMIGDDEARTLNTLIDKMRG